MLATLTSKGQVTLPAPIRAALKLDAGARLDFALQDDGSIRIVPVSHDPLAVSKILPKPPRELVSDAGIRAAIAERATARFMRSAKRSARLSRRYSPTPPMSSTHAKPLRRRSRSLATERRIFPTA